ncbi:MAG TPA: hypothetical protein ENK86_05100 [Campylobacterales bacterium]|nr:hypothetical protein [Campylobacterales bacterium]
MGEEETDAKYKTKQELFDAYEQGFDDCPLEFADEVLLRDREFVREAIKVNPVLADIIKRRGVTCLSKSCKRLLWERRGQIYSDTILSREDSGKLNFKTQQGILIEKQERQCTDCHYGRGFR